jgi:hypothetical protein
MAGSTINQQAKLGIPAESRLVAIQQSMPKVIFFQSSLQLNSHITNFNNLSCVNSMIHTVMEFFVYPAPALVNVPVSGDAEIDPFHVVTW